MASYNEEIFEAVQANFEYLNGADANDVALFLESVGESLYDGEIVEHIAAALRDVDTGVV